MRWLISWRDRETGDHGIVFIDAQSYDDAARAWLADNPSRMICDAYQVW